MNSIAPDPDKQVINAMLLQDEKDTIRQEMLQDALHERNMRTDIEYFFKHSNFDQLKSDYDKLHKQMWDYGYYDSLKDYL